MAKTQTGHGSEPRITPKLSNAIDLLLSGECKTLTAAAEKAGLRREHLSKWLRKPHVTVELERRVRSRLGTHGLLAASATLERLSHSAVSEYVQADVAKHILSISGVKPTADAAQGAGGGFSYRLVINGQTIDFAANPQPIGAPSVQTIEHAPQSHGFPDVPRADHVLAEGVRDEKRGEGVDD